MNQRNDRLTHARAGARRVARGVTALAALGTALASGASSPSAAGAQTPLPRDTVRTDTLRADTTGRRGTLPDSLRRAASDSAARDSAVAQARRTGAPGGTFLDRLGVDRLRLTAVGVSVGGAWPRRVQGARLYAVHANYGEIVPAVHLVFETSYWTSQYDGAAVRGLETAVRAATGVDTVRFGRIRSSDLTMATDLRWQPGRRRPPGSRPPFVRPFLGGGLAVHFVDVEGIPLNDTFVEQTLDGVALGFGASAGVDVAILPNVSLTMHARYDLYSGAHFASLRAGGRYRFDAVPAATRRLLAPVRTP